MKQQCKDVVYKSVIYLPLWLCICGTSTCTPNEAVDKQWGQRGDRLSLSHVVLQHGYWQLKHWKLSECLHRMVQLSSGSLVDLPSSRSCDPWNTDCVWFFSDAVKLQISYSWIMSITWMMMNNINSSWILISLFGWQVLSILCVRDFGKYLVLGWILMLCMYLP